MELRVIPRMLSPTSFFKPFSGHIILIAVRILAPKPYLIVNISGERDQYYNFSAIDQILEFFFFSVLKQEAFKGKT